MIDDFYHAARELRATVIAELVAKGETVGQAQVNKAYHAAMLALAEHRKVAAFATLKDIEAQAAAAKAEHRRLQSIETNTYRLFGAAQEQVCEVAMRSPHLVQGYAESLDMAAAVNDAVKAAQQAGS